MPQHLDYASNVYLAVSLTPSSTYTSTPISLANYPSVSSIGNVGELQDVKLLSIPKDEWNTAGEDIMDALKGDKENILQVFVQEPKTRKKRGGDEL